MTRGDLLEEETPPVRHPQLQGDLVQLSLKHVVELRPSSPFHFDATVHKPDHFPSADNAWRPGVRWQTLRFEDALLGLKLENIGTLERPRIRLSVWAGDDRDAGFYERLAGEIEYRFNLALDLAGFYRGFGDDPQLGPVITRWRGMRPAHAPGSPTTEESSSRSGLPPSWLPQPRTTCGRSGLATAHARSGE